MVTRRILDVIDLGSRGYVETLALQRALRESVVDGTNAHDTLVLVEHEPVYTLGRGTLPSSLPVPVEQLERAGAHVVEVERGGDVTWHGPGQLTGYPVIDLAHHREDLHWYLRTLEQVLISTLARFSISATTVPGRTGVWTGGRKIASIGVHVRRWVTLHGFALNIDPDLSWFGRIVPCGIAGVTMTSMARELNHTADRVALRREVVRTVSEEFAAALGLTVIDAPRDQMQSVAAE